MVTERAEHMVTPDSFDAVLFDMDGVLTTTARVQAACWERTFNDFLRAWDDEHGTSTPQFSVAEDYTAHVDGKMREDGVRGFLASRGIELPEGSDDSTPGEWTVRGIGFRKQEMLDEHLTDVGVEAFPGSVAWLRELRDAGLSTAVVTASTNGEALLEVAGLSNLIDTRVDGVVAAELGLAGKPAPDMFLEAARRLGVDPERAVVVEDARAGVEAGRAGGFGLVIGVDRFDHSQVLLDGGADLVVGDLGELVTAAPGDEHPAGPRLHRLKAAALRLLAAEGDFPVEGFRLVERSYNPPFVPQLETLFAVSNGYLGIRGTHDEGRPVHASATLLNGFHETWPIVYPETAYGFARTGQTILSVPDATVIRLYVDDEPFDLDAVEIEDYERALDMRSGTTDRRVVWRAPDGRRFSVRSRRLVSLEFRHLASIEYEVTPLDGGAHLRIASDIVNRYGAEELKFADPSDDSTSTSARAAGAGRPDPRRSRRFEAGVLRPLAHHVEGSRVVMCLETRASGMRVACGCDHEMTTDGSIEPQVRMGDDWARVVYRVDAEAGQTVRLVKHLAYHHDGEETVDELCFRVEATLDRARLDGFDGVLAAQRRRMNRFWEHSDVVTEGAALLQQAVRFSVFQIAQASARVEGYGIPAKGLTGEGYEGHYFWDTEIYVVPFLIYTAPAVAKAVLKHRYAMLDSARARAAELGHPGALFPWRTITGEEASAYYAAGTAQYHINADIAYAVMHYVRVTGDLDFLVRYGAEILVETARFWADLGFFSERKGGAFVINGVTGPDEYSTVVDNNAYTNLMACENLRAALFALEWLEDERPDAYARVAQVTHLDAAERDDWRRAADLMYVPRDEHTGVHLQDDEFMEREPWDFAGTPPEHYPLLLHFHPLEIYRHQVIKQADVVLATFLLPDAFTAEEKQRIFETYDPLTTGDSSLSECIQSIVAMDTANVRAGEEYFVDAATVDLADVAGNVRDGVHVASAGGTWLALVYGFAGLRDRDSVLSFKPYLPERLTKLSFNLVQRGCRIAVEIGPGKVTYRLVEGDRLVIADHDEEIELVAGAPETRPLRTLSADDEQT